MSEYRYGFLAGLGTGMMVVALLVGLLSCSTPIHIQDPVSVQLWTDAPGQPDPLEECQRLTTGGCVVMSVEALAWWTTKWAACEEQLDAYEEAK